MGAESGLVENGGAAFYRVKSMSKEMCHPVPVRADWGGEGRQPAILWLLPDRCTPAFHLDIARRDASVRSRKPE